MRIMVVDFDGNTVRAVEYDVIEAGHLSGYTERFAYIHEQLQRIIRQHRPEVAAVEEVFTSKALKRSIEIGEGRGVAILTCALAGLPVESYSVKTVKKSVVGNGNAHKSQVQNMVKLLLNLSEIPKPDDAADALAIAICHSHRCRLNPILKQQQRGATPR
ncbi:MAG: crossover junction endodeoxyribonuclease RuvC [Planctomycetota bacterium]|jgi:crossover junction endodeoxyribonuclease RuvC